MAASLLVLEASAQAATCTWTGSAGDTKWSNSANWSSGMGASCPPTSGTAANFSSGSAACTIDVSATDATLTISGYTGTITQSSALSVTGAVTMSSGTFVQAAPLTIGGTFKQTGGTFIGSNNPLKIDVNGSLLLQGGSFTSTDGSLQVAGVFSDTGGTFNANNGQMMLNSASGTSAPSFNGVTLYDVIVNDGLAAYWKLDEASGTNAADVSGYANTGTLQGSPTWATSSLPGVSFHDASAVTLDGSSQYIDVASVATTSNVAFTACAWVKFSSLSGAHTIVSETGTNSSAFILRRDSGGKFAFLMTGSDVASPTTYQTTGTTTVATGSWYHVCGVYSGSTGTLYVNGSAEGTAVTVSNKWAATGHTYIGADKWAGATGDFVPGTVDDVRIYSRALSASDISTLAAGNQPTSGVDTQTLSGPLNISHDLVIASGTLAAGSNAVTVGGSWWNYGGAFTGTAAVTLSGTGTDNVIRSNGLSFPALTVSGTGTWTLRSGLLVSGDLTISAGTLAAGSQSISVGGNWSNAGTFTFTAPETVTLTSTSAAATITSGGSSFNALTINGSGGTYTLQDALSATGDLTLTAGTLAASSKNLSVGGNLSMTAGSFTGGAGTVAVTGNLSMTGGIYTGGAGTATVGGNVSVTQSGTGSDPTLVGYWPLENSSSDLSGNGNDLTSNSGTFVTSAPSSVSGDTYSLSMNGTTQSASTAVLSGSGLAELRPTTVTLSAWFKAKSVDTNGSEIVSGSNTYGLRLTTAGLTVMKRITDNTSANDWIEYRVPETNHLDGNWHQIVAVIITGPGGSMTAYYDSTVAFGSYYVNGSAAGNPTLLSNSTTPTATAAAQAAIDWDANTETYGLVIGNNPSTGGYHFGGGGQCASNACAIDDVRVYNRALTAAEVAALSHGNAPGGSTGVLSLAGTMNVTGSIGIQATGTLTLGSGSSLGVGTGLTMDGTLNATTATITKSGASRYPLVVGSTSSAAPELNISGLSVQYTDSNGMQVNSSGGSSTGASTTFTAFDNVAFTNGTGNQALLIYASNLYLSSNGCSFGAGTTYAVKMTAVGSSNPRALFGKATCPTNDATTGLCATTEKQDSDGDNNGIPDSGNGAVVQFIRGAEDDTDGTLVGYPTAGFDWNTFTYYSTYVTFHDASAGNDVIYVRDEAGNPLYSWTDTTSGETLVGTPQWITDSGTGKHYLYVAANGGSSNTGKVYRLVDTGTQNTSGTLTLDTAWNASGGASSGVYSCTCTITSALSLDKNNVYWAATNASGQRLFGIKQADGTSPSATVGSWPVTAPANVTTSAPTLVISGTTSSLYLGVTSVLAEIADTTKLTWLQDNPTGIGTITGRVSYGTSWLAATNGTTRIYVGDSNGAVYAVSPSAFSASGPPTTYLWKYAGGSAVTDNYYDGGTDTVMFGTSGGAVVALTGAGSGTNGAVVNSSYPYTLPNSDSVSTAPLYYSGVLVVGSTKGNLYFLDRNTGNATAPNGVKILKEVNFGSTESVSTIGFDSTYSRYMVSTSSAANDGRVYYFDLVSDPTPSTP